MRWARLRGMAILLAVAAFVLFVYTLLHEGGHALVGLLAGQQLVAMNVDFVTLGAHVRMAGDISGPWRTLQTAAGAGLPLLVWAALMLAVPRRASPLLELVKTASALSVLSSLLPWVVFPLLVALGRQPPRDDVLAFLASSGAPPLLVAGVAGLVYLAGWALYLRRIAGVRHELALLRRPSLDDAGTRPVLLAMAGVAAAGLLLLLAANAGGARIDPSAPPTGYELLGTLSLSGQAYAGGDLGTFTLDSPAEVGLFLLVRDIDTPYLDIALEGPGGFRVPILHGESYRARRDSAHPILQLEPGRYQVVLNSQPSPGTVSLYLKLD